MTQRRANYQANSTETGDPAMLRALVEQLQAEVARLRAENAALTERASRPAEDPKPPQPTRPGYLVITPSPYYSGAYQGLHFTRGQAFLPDGEDSRQRALTLADELGYSVLWIADYTGPFDRPDTQNRPVQPPPEPSLREEWLAFFGG